MCLLWFCFLFVCFQVLPHQYLSWYNAITSPSSLLSELDRRSLLIAFLVLVWLAKEHSQVSRMGKSTACLLLWGYAHVSPQNCLFWGLGFGTLFCSILRPLLATLLPPCLADFVAMPQGCCACVGQAVVCRASSLHLSLLHAIDYAWDLTVYLLQVKHVLTMCGLWMYSCSLFEQFCPPKFPFLLWLKLLVCCTIEPDRPADRWMKMM